MPRSIDELLKLFPYSTSMREVETAISDVEWSRRFKDYLIKRDLHENHDSLKFVMAVRSLEAAAGGGTKGRKHHMEYADKLKFCTEILNYFFDDESDKGLLPMSNDSLQEELSRLQREGSATLEPRFSLLQRACRDSTVFAEGLEPRYMKFVEDYLKNSSAMACLLSIL